jgi:glutathione S-transferase
MLKYTYTYVSSVELGCFQTSTLRNSKMKIVSYAICPYVQRVTALLEAKKISYEIEFISLGDKPQWFLDISPNGQVPILITDDGETIFESDAIVEYLEEITPPLVDDVSPVQRANDRAWSYQASKHYIPQCSAMQSPDKNELSVRSTPLNQSFTKAEKKLGAGPFFNGTIMGNVDIAWLPLLHRAQIIKDQSGYDFLANFPKMQKWQDAVMKTGISEKSVSEEFEDRFVNFYLSEKTFLGRGANLNEASAETEAKKSAGCCG